MPSRTRRVLLTVLVLLAGIGAGAGAWWLYRCFSEEDGPGRAEATAVPPPDPAMRAEVRRLLQKRHFGMSIDLLDEAREGFWRLGDKAVPALIHEMVTTYETAGGRGVNGDVPPGLGPNAWRRGV